MALHIFDIDGRGHIIEDSLQERLIALQCFLGMFALDNFVLQSLVCLQKLGSTLLNSLLELFLRLEQSLLHLFPAGNIYAQFQHQQGSIIIHKGIIVDLIRASIYGSCFPFLGGSRVCKNLKCLAVFAGFFFALHDLVAVAILGVAKAFTKEAVGEADGVIGCLQADIGREFFQQGKDALVFAFLLVVVLVFAGRVYGAANHRLHGIVVF